MIDTVIGLCYDRITYERIRSFECGELNFEDMVSKIPGKIVFKLQCAFFLEVEKKEQRNLLYQTRREL